MTEEQKQKIISALDALTDASPAYSHGRADALLRSAISAAGHPEIADAYLRAEERVGFGYIRIHHDNEDV